MEEPESPASFLGDIWLKDNRLWAYLFSVVAYILLVPFVLLLIDKLSDMMIMLAVVGYAIGMAVIIAWIMEQGFKS